MEPHTGPFTLTHTPAGRPLTCTPPSSLSSTYPTPIPSTILAPAYSQSLAESCALPAGHPWVSLSI